MASTEHCVARRTRMNECGRASGWQHDVSFSHREAFVGRKCKATREWGDFEPEAGTADLGGNDDRQGCGQKHELATNVVPPNSDNEHHRLT